MNGLPDAMFNLQRSEISIYHRHNDGEPEREKKGEQEARGARSEASFPPPVLPHELNTNWKKRSSVCVARALIRACECSTSFFLRRGLESYICSSPLSLLPINREVQYLHLVLALLPPTLPLLLYPDAPCKHTSSGIIVMLEARRHSS